MLKRPIDRPLIALFIAIAIILALLGASAFRRYLVNDDYQILYTAWMKSVGLRPGQDFFMPSYHLLTEPLVFLYRLCGESFLPLYVGRFAVIAVLATSAYFLFSVTREVCGSFAAVLAPPLALTTAAVIHRGLDLRPDAITTCLWLAVFSALLQPLRTCRRSFWVGILLGLSFVNRFKAAVILPIVLAVVLFDTVKERTSLRRLSFLCVFMAAGAILVLTLYLLYLSQTDEVFTYLATLRDLATSAGELRASSGPKQTLARAFAVDRAFWILASVGTAIRVTLGPSRSARQNVLAAALVLLAVGSVVLNPAYYDYNLVTLTFLLAPFAAMAPGFLLQQAAVRNATRRVARVAAAVLPFAPILFHYNLLAYAARTDTMKHQRALDRFLRQYTTPDTRIFALEGIGLFRRSIYHWRMPEVLRGRYQRGAWRFENELRQSPAHILVLNYRLPHWLIETDRQFLREHYVPLTRYLYVLGYRSQGPGTASFSLLASGSYEIIAPQAGCRIDGDLVSDRQVLVLREGVHRLESPDGPCGLRLYFPPEALATLQNPAGRPYLYPPTLMRVAAP